MIPTFNEATEVIFDRTTKEFHVAGEVWLGSELRWRHTVLVPRTETHAELECRQGEAREAALRYAWAMAKVDLARWNDYAAGR